MSTWAVLATGPSMCQALADSVRGRCYVVAVSDSYRLAPWADAIASSDIAWWRQHPQAMGLPGVKFTAAPTWQGADQLARVPEAVSGTNSGLLGLMVAVRMGAKRVLLLGLDLRGDHFFGRHPEPLKNPDDHRFAVFCRQFEAYRPRGVEILNCTPGSALDVYPRADLADCLAEPAIQHG